MTPPDADPDPDSERDPKHEPDPGSGDPIFKFKKKVDDDWKRKVEEEKERLSEPPKQRERPRPETVSSAAAGKPGSAASSSSPPSSSASSAESGAAAPGAPSEDEFEDERSGAPATPFLRFIGDLANQALTALGVYPDPMTRTRQVSLEQARYIIDVLRILKEKTKGNLSPDELRVVDGLLYELQIQFVELNR
jgi:hypothetical protein